MNDVSLHGCSVHTEYGMTRAEADLTIVNSLDQRASYWITVAVDGGDGARLGEIFAIRNDLGAGQTAQIAGDAASAMLQSSAKQVACSVVDDDRTTIARRSDSCAEPARTPLGAVHRKEKRPLAVMAGGRFRVVASGL